MQRGECTTHSQRRQHLRLILRHRPRIPGAGLNPENNVSKRKPFALRVNEDILRAVQRWSNDELRSLNGQIEYLLRDALRKAGRLPKAKHDPD